MVFYKKKQETFKTGKLDIIVVIIVSVVFYWALFIDSFKIATYPNGTIMIDPRTLQPMTKINLQVIIAPLILCYEMLLVRLEGKKRGRYICWSFYYCLFKYKVYLKYMEGRQLTKEYLEKRKIK